MKRFFYKAKDMQGRLVAGEVEAQSLAEAAKLVRNKKLYVISIRVKLESSLNIFRRFRDRISSATVANFTRQFATMVNAGLPITEALLILRAQSTRTMQKVVAQILADVEAGDSLSSALSKHPAVFSRTYIALIKSGEAGGVMEKVLLRLADNLEKELEFNGKVKSALIYPVIIVIGLIAVSMIMLVFVIPKLLTLYQDFNSVLPISTRILIAVSGFLVNFWWLIIILIFGAVYGLKLYTKTEAGRRRVDELLFKIPIVGDILRQIVLTEFTRTLSLMAASGVPILEALNITAEVVSNSVISSALKDSAKDVERGFPIAYAFARHPDAFPFLLSQMVAVGEETGKMDEILGKISHIFEVESDEKVKNLTTLIEPIVMVVLGAGVAFLILAIIMPIYNVTNQF